MLCIVPLESLVKDERLYERLFGESFLYFYRNRERYWDWQAVVIYPSRSLEQSDMHPYRALLGSNQVHRVYLEELGEIRQLPLEVALMVLTTVKEDQAPEEARYLLARSRQEVQEPESSRAIIELVTTIIVYKFAQLSRVEVEAMLGLKLEETRIYQEAKAEEAASLVLRLLTRRLKQELSSEAKSQIIALPLPLLEELGEALLDFKQLADLLGWLEQHQPQ